MRIVTTTARGIPELTSNTPSGATIVATGSALTYRGVKRAASDLASVWLDVEPHEIEVDVVIEAPNDVVELITQSNLAAAEAEAAIARTDQLRREAARALRAEGYPLEAAGAILGVSYQRVQQLAS
ncbi:hypothetical protein GCM10027414_24220 [Humibacter ginsengiterrae]